MTTSWPIGYGSCSQSSLTGADSARFISRIHHQDEHHVPGYVEDVAQLGPYLNQPVETYPAGMNARLAFGISLATNFECYLVDEVTGAGDERFRIRCAEALLQRGDYAMVTMRG